jgi:hypothetical protein
MPAQKAEAKRLARRGVVWRRRRRKVGIQNAIMLSAPT